VVSIVVPVRGGAADDAVRRREEEPDFSVLLAMTRSLLKVNPS